MILAQCAILSILILIKITFSGCPPLNSTSRLDDYVNVSSSIIYDTRKKYFELFVTSVLLDFLAVTIVLAQLVTLDAWTDFQLSQEFQNFFQVFGQVPQNRTDKLAQLFPTKTRCTVTGFSSTDSVRKEDFICNLGLMDSYEKSCAVIFVFLILVLCLCVVFYGHFILKFLAKGCKQLFSGFWNWRNQRVSKQFQKF